MLPLCAWSQYAGPVSKKADANDLRAIAVLEWTGPAGKPKACRIVPITIYDGEHLQDAGIYMARPQPLALSSQVEYQLKDNGRTIGLFDVTNAGQEQGSWVGYGDWKPVPTAKKAAIAPLLDEGSNDDDKPVLHRKHHADDPGSGSGTASSSPSSKPQSDSDSDRPKLHKKDDSGSGSDSDHPVLHKSPSSDSSDTASSAPSDPDRPVLKKPKPQSAQQPTEDVGHVESMSTVTDPDRPHLAPGKPADSGPAVLPTLMGLPPDLQQAVAVSDPKDRPDHLWVYSWANPADQDKMRAALEEIARTALGLDTSPPPAPKPATPPARRTTARKAAAPPPPPPYPQPLRDEKFRVFELAYGSGATMVFTADTGGSLATEKFVTVIAQPDLYGNIAVLYKSVTDGSHLDDTPRMRLVDAVDAEADNRGELLFELRGATARQFALFRVLRGSAERIFTTGSETIGAITPE